MQSNMNPSIPLALRRIANAAIVMSALFSMQADAQQVSRFRTMTLNAGMHVIQAEVAATEAERQQGLMFRERMANNEGMVFIFPRPAGICMWMKNTLLPLSVAFIDDSGTIVNIEDMQPQTTESHCAAKDVRFALEMNQGWFRQKGFKAGSRIDGLPQMR